LHQQSHFKRKDHVRHELQSLRKWPEQWGLMTREYTRLNRRMIGERLTPEAGDSLYPTRCPSVGSDQSTASSSSRRSTPGFSSTRLPSILGSSPMSCSPVHPYHDSHHRARLPTISTGSPEGVPERVQRPFPAFPKTTSAEIGWQSAIPENKLEVYGRYAPNARGQHGILKLLDWPRQSIM
ncbi:uncharacterized protein LOC117290078, partial [Asterias rubens]|uniref:uncharacterized protein LOC117290078 n=1 Tax=Asterias rubens TaxID=7604 RepID=UPI001455B3F2